MSSILFRGLKPEPLLRSAMQALPALPAHWRGRDKPCGSRSISPLAPLPILDRQSSACASAWAFWRWWPSLSGSACTLFTTGRTGARSASTPWTPRLRASTQERQGYQNLMHRPDNAQLLKQADALNQLFDEKAFSWTLAMENLETVLPGGVQVTTLEPFAPRTATSHSTCASSVRAIAPSNWFAISNTRAASLSPASLVKVPRAPIWPNQRLEPVSATNRFNFDLLAEYNPPTPEEAQSSIEVAKTPRRRADEQRITLNPRRLQASMPPACSPTGQPVHQTQHREVRDEQRKNLLRLARTLDVATYLALRRIRCAAAAGYWPWCSSWP